jgi:hypothetical protein
MKFDKHIHKYLQEMAKGDVTPFFDQPSTGTYLSGSGPRGKNVKNVKKSNVPGLNVGAMRGKAHQEQGGDFLNDPRDTPRVSCAKALSQLVNDQYMDENGDSLQTAKNLKIIVIDNFVRNLISLQTLEIPEKEKSLRIFNDENEQEMELTLPEAASEILDILRFLVEEYGEDFIPVKVGENGELQGITAPTRQQIEAPAENASAEEKQVWEQEQERKRELDKLRINWNWAINTLKQEAGKDVKMKRMQSAEGTNIFCLDIQSTPNLWTIQTVKNSENLRMIKGRAEEGATIEHVQRKSWLQGEDEATLPLAFENGIPTYGQVIQPNWLRNRSGKEFIAKIGHKVIEKIIIAKFGLPSAGIEPRQTFTFDNGVTINLDEWDCSVYDLSPDPHKNRRKKIQVARTPKRPLPVAQRPVVAQQEETEEEE